jgi:hypothetical protein
MTKILIFILSLYKKYLSRPLSQSFGNACRFTPTCSEYTIEALEKYGFPKGMLMGLKRIGKCHPWGGFGFDPVK